MNFELTETQKMLRATIREFVEKELPKEFVRKWDSDENMTWLPKNILNKAAELGFTAISVPKEYGGLGSDLIDDVILAEEISRRCPAAYFALSAGIFVRLIEEFGNEKQKMEYLPKLATAEIGFCIALTEPGGGTDLIGALKTTAIDDGDDFIINGQKTYISGAHVQPYMVTLAITDKNAPKKSKATSLFLIDRNSPGIEIRPLHKISMRGAGTNEVYFNDVRVPKSNLLGELNKGFSQLMSLLNPERIVCAAQTVGIAQGAYEEALEYAKTRMAFGKPIGQFQVIQHWLADMWIEIELSRLITYKAAWQFANKQPCHLEAAAAKVFAADTAVKVTTNAMEIFAGSGLMVETDIQRYFRDARQFTFSPISNEMARNFIGELSGLPRSF
jgi:acyl-CoA dehydrogenase